MNLKTLFFYLFLFLSILSNAQVSYVDRIEFDVNNGFSNEDLQLFGEEGFIMTFRSDEFERGSTTWKYEKFNNNLENVASKSISLLRKFTPEGSYADENRTHNFYKDRSGNFSLITLEASDLSMTKVNGRLPNRNRISEMVVLGDYALLSGRLKRKDVIFKVNWKTGAVGVLPINIEGFKSSRITIENFQILKKSKEVFVFVRAKISKRKSRMFLISLNENGNKTQSFDLSKYTDGKNITSISAAKTKNGNHVFTGTYSSSSSYTSEGLFFAEGQKGGLNYIKFYNFLDFDNFLSYLPDRKERKYKKRQERRESSGKEYAVNFRIADHDIIEREDGYVFLGEAYYPTYRTETRTVTRTVNGVTTTTTQTVQVFDGFQYTHAVVAKFDKKGSLVWDKTFSMWQAYKPFYVKRFIEVAEETQSSINLVFASGSYLYSKSFDTQIGTVIKDEKSEEIKTVFKGDEVRRSFSNIDYWYGKYFLAHGYQKIKNKENNKVDRKRKVYFFSKVKY